MKADDSMPSEPGRDTAPVTPAHGSQPKDRHQPGDIVDGKYRLGAVLGAGGMGTVFEATHLALGETVAIKLVTLGSSDGAERLRREARIALRITGEHVVRAMDVGTLPSGAPYVVMERLVGQNLAEVLRARGPLPLEDAVDFVLQACVAMAEAHAIGVVHRDLKPSNLFLTRRADGSPLVKVLDFGIAKADAMTAADGAPLESLTLSTSMLGSPQYMAPEQVRAAKDIDARADVWALGVILHELSAGAPPFSGDTPSAVLASIAADPPEALRARRPDAPPGLADAIARCLEKDPARRMPSVAALAEALAPFAPARSRVALERIAGIGGAMTPARPEGVVTHAPRIEPGVILEERYRVEALVGSGGMGSVWRAMDLVLSREVAIKTLHQIDDQDAAVQFRCEARVLASLDHPRIVPIYDLLLVEQPGGASLPCIVMPLLDGKPLSERLASSGALGVAEACRLLDELLEVLETVHAAGVVHRDIKPSNLMLVRRGATEVLCLMDFGLAHVRKPDAPASPHASDVVGTPFYMSPEQLTRPEAVDARADLWAAAICFFELVTGKTPFAAASVPETIAAILRGAWTPASALSATATPSVDAFFDAALARAIDARPASASAMREMLARLRRETLALPAPPGRAPQTATTPKATTPPKAITPPKATTPPAAGAARPPSSGQRPGATRESLTFRLVDEIIVVAHTVDPPTPASFARYVEAAVALQHRVGARARCFVMTDGGAPDAQQREVLKERLRADQYVTAVISSSARIPFVTVSLALFRPVQSFRPEEIDAALRHLGVAPRRLRDILDAAWSMREELGSCAIIDSLLALRRAPPR